MEKEFIPYNEALALKGLGFDEPCFAFYNGKFLDYKIQGGDICSPYLSTENIGECPNAPTFSQVFRWFREKYSLVACNDYGNNEYFYWIVSKDEQIFFSIEDEEENTITYKSYEEAELECLKKLIEIVKQW